MNSINILFFVLGFSGAITVELIPFKVSETIRERSCVKEKFDIYDGTSESDIKIPFEGESSFRLDIDERFFEDECIQRFRAYSGVLGSHDFVSLFLVGNKSIKYEHAVSLIDLYDKIRLLTDGRTNFRETLVQELEDKGYPCVLFNDPSEEWKRNFEDVLLSTKEYKGNDRGEYFSIFKDNLTILLELLYDKNIYRDIYERIRSLKIFEIYSVEEDVCHKLIMLNDVINIESKALVRYGTEIFKDMVTLPICLWINN
ncbi:hypothetical protein P3W45_000734 [Vairimorpha bombi]|jgi:hypothetical protein